MAEQLPVSENALAGDAKDPWSSASASLAERYAAHVAPTFVALARRVVDLAEIEPGHTVLDLGTRTGLTAFLAAERAGREGSVIGLDPSPAMIHLAQARASSVGYGHIRWQQGLPAPLTYADESFDAVLSVQALMHFGSPVAALEEMRRVLVEDGRAVVTVWGARASNEWQRLLEEAVRRAAPEVAPPGSFPLSQAGNLDALLQAAGLEQIEIARMPDVMRFQGVDAFWEWANAIGTWSALLGGLSAERRERVRRELHAALGPQLRDGEVAIGREIVYARAVAPAAF